MSGALLLHILPPASSWKIVGVERRAVIEPVIGANRLGPMIIGRPGRIVGTIVTRDVPPNPGSVAIEHAETVV